MEIEGNELMETLEPEQNLKYHMIWDKRDVYGEKVYGRYVKYKTQENILLLFGVSINW